MEEECWNRALAGESFSAVNGTNQRFGALTELKGAFKYMHRYSHVDLEKSTKFQQPETSKDTSPEVSPMEQAGQKRRQNFHITSEPGTLLWKVNQFGIWYQQNDTWEKFTGQTFEDCKELGWIQAHHPEDQEILKKMWSQMGNSVSYFRYCTRIWSAKQQQFRYFQVHVAKEHRNGNGAKEWNCVSLDITETKLYRRTMKRLMNRLRLALAAANVGTWEWDFQNDIMTADYKLYGIHGGAPMAVTFTRFLEAIHPEDRYQVQQKSIMCAENGTPYDAEFRTFWLDGSIHWMVGKGKRYFCKEGKPYMLGVNWDITAMKEAEIQYVRAVQQQEELRLAKETAELERQHKVNQEEFIDTVCHEIRNPLVGIYGGVHIARDALQEIKKEISKIMPDAQIESCRIISTLSDNLEAIQQCADQQKVIVDDVLDLSKLEARKVELNPTPFSLRACVNNVLHMYSTNIKEKGLTVDVELPEGDLWIKADKHRFQQIIINLVSNAVKFTQEGGISVRAFASPEESVLKVQVEDTGIGIAASEVPSLFEKFTQAKRAACNKFGGSGLGLAISKRLVETMGGKITVWSTQGVGSTFQFTIKYQQVTEQEKEEKIQSNNKDNSQQGSKIGQKHILIVDDNKMNQKILANYLEKEGHICRTANNGLEALEKSQQEHFDMIFMDIEMPVMNGLEATKIIRQREKGHHQPVIGLSGNARKEKVEAAYQAGMDDYLTKPYNKGDIINVINKTLMPETDTPKAEQNLKRQKLTHPVN